jgi:hypothetical protein
LLKPGDQKSYFPFDQTFSFLKSISIRKSFCTGRVQFNGKGLVHQLEWPDNNNIKRYSIVLRDKNNKQNKVPDII